MAELAFALGRDGQQLVQSRFLWTLRSHLHLPALAGGIRAPEIDAPLSDY
jgi:hypothetical protein